MHQNHIKSGDRCRWMFLAIFFLAWIDIFAEFERQRSSENPCHKQLIVAVYAGKFTNDKSLGAVKRLKS